MCGASVPLSVQEVAPSCSHCQHSTPLTPEIREGLNSLRARLATSDDTTRQLTAASIIRGDNLHGAGLITIVVCWLLFGGIAIYVSLDHDVPLIEFLLSGTPASQWWLLWSMMLGLFLSIGFLECSIAFVRATKMQALPAPPLRPGNPARCRCCGAELPPTGVLQRCSYCRSDNLVITGRYLATQQSAERAMADMANAMDRNLTSRIDNGGKIAMGAGVLPLGLLFIGPAVGLAVPGNSSLWLVPGAAMLFATAAAIIAARLRLPCEAVELMTFGQRVCIEPEIRRRVCAQLMTAEGPIHFLGKNLTKVDFAVATRRNGDQVEVLVYDVAHSSQRANPESRDQLVVSEVWEQSNDAAPKIRPVWLRATATGWSLYEGDEFIPLLEGKLRPEAPRVFCY
jgi:hypothetical protein